jgi:serine/threonine protein kinase
VRQQEQMEAVLTECRILQALDHSALPQVLGFLPSVPELSIVMTLMPGKPLHSVIHPTPLNSAPANSTPLPLADVLRIALCLADVLEYAAFAPTTPVFCM